MLRPALTTLLVTLSAGALSLTAIYALLVANCRQGIKYYYG